MHASAPRDSRRIGKLVRRLHDQHKETIERAGEIMGVIAAPIFFVLASARRYSHVFHNRGDCADADVTVADGVPPQYRSLAERLTGHAFVRLSDSLTVRKARWPDVLGCAIRFGGYVDDPAIEGDQDLLFATVRRPWTMLLAPFSTNVHDYLANDYFTVSPFYAPRTGTAITRPTRGPRLYFRLRPASREPGALVSIETSTGPVSSTRASSAGSRRSRAERRRRRLERAIANGAAAFTLGVAESPWGPFAPLVHLQLVSVHYTEPANVRFDPFRSGRGIEPHGFVHALRRSIYAASQRAR
jgi:hypothetical protein